MGNKIRKVQFMHVKASQRATFIRPSGHSERETCKFFLSTGCKFGANCHFKHVGRDRDRDRRRSRSRSRERRYRYDSDDDRKGDSSDDEHERRKRERKRREEKEKVGRVELL